MESTGQLTRSAAAVYDDFFVPALFAEWPPRLAEVAGLGPDRRVLDVACGTGIFAREAARRVGAASVVGLDCNDGMLAVARERAPEIDWRAGRAESLPFDDASFDAVACQFGLMFFEDRAGALAEMRRVLRPGGRLVVAVWGRLEATPGYRAMVALLDRLFGPEIAAELRAPFALGEPGELESLLAAAAIADPQIDEVVGTARFPSIAAWVETDIRGWTLADKIDDRQLARLAAAASDELAGFVSDGQVSFDSPALIASATG